MDDESENAIKDDVYNIYETLKTDWKKAKSIEDIYKPLNKWARDNDIAYSKSDEGVIEMSLNATDDYIKAPKTILHCKIGLKQKKSKAQCAAIAMAAMKNSKEHGSIRLLLTSDASAVKKDQLKADNLISLDYCKKAQLYTGSAASKEYLLYHNIKKEKTTGNVSYRVVISGLEGGDSSDRTRKHGNPIKNLGDLLRSCQSHGLAFQLYDFKGGTSADTYPSSAETTITVDKNDEKKLVERIKDAENSFEDANRKNENNLKYTSTKCKTPAKSYSHKDTAAIISFLYTIEDEVFKAYQSEEDEDEGVKTIATIGKISSNGKFALNIKGRSIAPAVFNQMFESYKNTAELSDFSIKETGSYPLWPYKETSNLTESFLVAAQQVGLDLETEWTFSENDCAVFYQKRQDIDMICLGSNIQDGYDIATGLVMYLQSLNGKQ